MESSNTTAEMVDAGTHDTLQSRKGYRIVSSVLGIILLVAAGLKAHELFTGPVAAEGWLGNRWLHAAVFEFEVLLGLWLLVGVLPRAAWGVALVTFGAFAGVTLYSALSGAASCGCFGRVKISPWYTFSLDVVAVAALLWYRPVSPPPRQDLPPVRRGFAVAALALVLVVTPVAALLALKEPVEIVDEADLQQLVQDQPRAIEEGELRTVGGTAMLKPQLWIDKRMPLFGKIDVGDQLREGRWTVVLYHHDCDHCREALPKYELLARERQADPAAPKMAFIETPPYGQPHQSPLTDSPALTGKLSDDVNWFVQTPVRMELNDGVVTAAKQGEEAVDPKM